MTKHIALLRGINVSGHHKVPMAELKAMMIEWGFHNPITLLNSGNVIFEFEDQPLDKIESDLSEKLSSHFGFSIPVILRTAIQLAQLLASEPFKNITVTKDIRLYISFIRPSQNSSISLPWSTEKGEFQILDVKDNSIISVLDLSVTKTTKGMETLEKLFGKDITTRNWNTVLKIAKKLSIVK